MDVILDIIKTLDSPVYLKKQEARGRVVAFGLSLMSLAHEVSFIKRKIDIELLVDDNVSTTFTDYDISAIQSRTINDNFKRMEIDLVQESDRLANIRFLSALREAFKQSGKDVSECVESYQWEVIKGEESSGLITFGKEYEYHVTTWTARQL